CRTPVCVISVTVKSAGGLQKTSRLSMTPDPFALIKCEGRKVKTSVQKDSLNPQWNTGALFFVRRPQKTRLIIQVWDSNWFWDAFMGQAKIPIDINNRAVTETHQLMGRRRNHQEKMAGAVTVEVKCYQDLLAI
ncbi:Calpain-6, partial [Desmophyllum pertusum]